MYISPPRIRISIYTSFKISRSYIAPMTENTTDNGESHVLKVLVLGDPATGKVLNVQGHQIDDVLYCEI